MEGIGFVGVNGLLAGRGRVQNGTCSQRPSVQTPRTMVVCPMKRLFVGGISWATDDEMLRDAFEEFGEVLDARVIYDRDSGRSRGFGFVTFDEATHADTAIDKMDGQELDGRVIRVNEARQKPRAPREE